MAYYHEEITLELGWVHLHSLVGVYTRKLMPVESPIVESLSRIDSQEFGICRFSIRSEGKEFFYLIYEQNCLLGLVVNKSIYI